MAAGQVDLLVILGGNPVYTAPADLEFAAAHRQGADCASTSAARRRDRRTLSHWHVPEAHFLESWSDARAFDGTASIVQPLIAPLYGGRSAHEVLAVLGATPEQVGATTSSASTG